MALTFGVPGLRGTLFPGCSAVANYCAIQLPLPYRLFGFCFRRLTFRLLLLSFGLPCLCYWLGLHFSAADVGCRYLLLLLESKFYGQALGLISTGQLSTLLHLHYQPINLVVYKESHSQNLSLVWLHA